MLFLTLLSGSNSKNEWKITKQNLIFIIYLFCSSSLHSGSHYEV